MSPDLFERLRNLDGWSYEICMSSKGFVAKMVKKDSKLCMMKTGDSMDDLACWILKEVESDQVSREA